jgi:signal transduction histidine kinase
MTLKNHAASAWVMNLLSITILMMLLVDWASYTILFISGGLLAWLAYYVTTPGSFSYMPGVLSYGDILSSFLTSIIMGIIFSRNKEKIEQEKLQAMAAVGGSIAHELRNPLLAINTNLNGIRKYVPFLLTGYQKANAHNLLEDKEKIRLDRFEVLLTAVEDASAEIQYANTMINMLLLKVKPNIKSGDMAICSIFDCIDDALRRYPFNSAEQAKLINWSMENDEDFNFKGSQLFIVHVLFNLIKNALYFVADAGKGQIYISTKIGKKTNTLHFKDTAKGIPAYVLPHVFTRFYTKTDTGTGLGLAFCKIVMTGMGGDITCKSQEGEYTEFILTFPKLDGSRQLISPEK